MIFLSVETQFTLQTIQHALFGVSSVLNLISLYCLIKETPPHQAKIRNYLLMTQIMVIINGIYTDILFEPIPLFPEIAGICTGILCRVAPPHSVLGGLIITYIWLAACIFFCCYFRHQTLLPEDAKLSKNKGRLLIFSALFLTIVPASTYSIIPFDASRIVTLISESPHNLGWVLGRGPYFIHARGPIILSFIAIAIALITGAVILFLGIFFNMFHILQRDKRRSVLTIRKVRRSLLLLFIQLMVPFFMLAIPAIALFSSLLCECIPFEANLSIFSLMIVHPIVHNLILLGITPTYRSIIKSFPSKLRNVSRAAERQATVSTQPRELLR